MTLSDGVLAHPDRFVDRHIGPRAGEVAAMLERLGLGSLEELVDQALPPDIRTRRALDLPRPRTEAEVLGELRALAAQNEPGRSLLGMGYHRCVTPAVIRRNILENPGWLTAYTPYQPEIAQGRLEALLNFQTLVADLTGLSCANASLLDEATAAAEAMTLCRRVARRTPSRRFFVSEAVHPQTLAVVRTRAEALGIEVEVGDHRALDTAGGLFGALVQYPATTGEIWDYAPLAGQVHAAGGLLVVAADPMALLVLRCPAAFGADVVVGSTQRFGVPPGYGGPHAAYLATREEWKRQVPGRIVGISRDAHGRPALRLALQTREQHIRRDRATSNICTAQVLLAVVASMYAVYHGPDRLRAIATRIRRHALTLAEGLLRIGCRLADAPFFDTLSVDPVHRSAAEVLAAASERGMDLRALGDGRVGVALDECTDLREVAEVLACFGGAPEEVAVLAEQVDDAIPAPHARQRPYLEAPVFHRHHDEAGFVRYLKRLEERDLSLTSSMIPLGSCTMKLNATAELEPITWPAFADLHPFAPRDRARGYAEVFRRLEAWLAEITGFHSVSLQPNAGSQGEYAGLMCIRAWHRSRGEGHRDVCLIPRSAHGTNPASSVMAGLRVVVVACDDDGDIDVADLEARAAEHADRLAALMVTYPSTHGVFEASIRHVCEVIHAHGGQVYLDGANLNAMVGLSRPAEWGADVCHLNLHKTFCIPHGGGGPGMGPIAVAEHLAPFLPGHPVVPGVGGEQAFGTVSAAPWGSPLILPISYAYIAMMGGRGLTRASQVAILAANYVAHRLDPHYPVLYRGRSGRVAHECIVDLRPLKATSGVTVDDVAKRLVDYGFHAPTMSFPVPGTLMIEPTESENLAELDRFCDAMIAIREEIREIEEGRMDRERNPLKLAPHTLDDLVGPWDRPYSRERAVFPAPWLRERKFWPAVNRIDNAWGDRHPICTCISPEAFAELVGG